MNRRTFFAAISTLAAAGAALAQEAYAKEGAKAKGPKHDRLSGRIVSVDKNGMSLEMSTRANPGARRKVKWDAATQFLESQKPATADVLKEGARVVAVGKFDGVDLMATRINVIPRP